MTENTVNRVIVGISGASGGELALEVLRQLRLWSDAELHVIVTESGETTLKYETGKDLSGLIRYADKVYSGRDMSAPPASGSLTTLGMVVVPCSMKTLAGIVTGYCDNLLLRAADVTLKERRKLILVPRECPFSTIHLRNMTAASELGAVIMAPVPAYYSFPCSIDDVNRFIAGKIIGHLGYENDLIEEWNGTTR